MRVSRVDGNADGHGSMKGGVEKEEEEEESM
jgi:hypothetical protein